jgi:hypothetical protein
MFTFCSPSLCSRFVLPAYVHVLFFCLQRLHIGIILIWPGAGSRHGGEEKSGRSRTQFNQLPEFMSRPESDAYNAYLKAGYSVGDKKPYQIRGKAKELLDTPKVNAFVAYIREKAMEKLVINIDDIVEKFLTTYNQAMASEDFTNANRALENLGKHLGMFVEKAMIEQKITMSTEQLDAEIAKYQGIIDAAIQQPVKH